VGNDQVGQDWADRAAGWVENEEIFDAVFAPVTAAVLGAAAIEPRHRLLDAGCGSGTLLAAGVAAGAAVVGIDISPGMADAARRRVAAATVVVDDAQEADLLAAAPGAPFDRVVSRFGVMFFADPAAAFANIRRLRPRRLGWSSPVGAGWKRTRCPPLAPASSPTGSIPSPNQFRRVLPVPRRSPIPTGW
jgi:SAM-dependent methyltransferase